MILNTSSVTKIKRQYEFLEIENQWRSIEQEIQEINQSVKGLVIQMHLIIGAFEGTLKPRQKKEDIPLGIKLQQEQF